MSVEEIISRISQLAHHYIQLEEKDYDGRKEVISFEQEALEMILQYCQHKGYQVSGFIGFQIESEENNHQDWMFNPQYFLDVLTLEKADVAKIHWHYFSSFWPDFAKNKEDF